MGKVPASNIKADKVEWLPGKNIVYGPNQIRDELLFLVERLTKLKIAQYELYATPNSSGHTITSLLPYHCQLNTIELVWAQI
jgi:hypothetical protein